MKKSLAIFLILAMVLCMVPMTAFADSAKTIAQISLATINEQTYTGKGVTPEVSVFLQPVNGSAYQLKNGTDYEVSYTNNTEVGTNAQAQVTLKGEVASRASAEGVTLANGGVITFTIKACALGSLYYDNLQGHPFDSEMNPYELANAVKQAVIIKDVGGTTLDIKDKINIAVSGSGSTRTVTFTPASSAGNSITGTGSTTISVGKLLSNYTLQGVKAVTYTGSNIELTGTYLQNSKTNETIAQSTGVYELAYIGDRVHAGNTATVKAVAKSGRDYVGETAAVQLQILPQNINAAGTKVQIREISNQIFNGTAVRPKIEVTETVGGSTKALIEGTDYTVSYLNNSSIGNGSAVITFIRDYTGTHTENFRIIDSANDLSKNEVKVTINGVTGGTVNGTNMTAPYDGGIVKPTISVTDSKGNLLYEGGQYRLYFRKDGVSTTSPKDAGVYDVYLEGIGAYGGEKWVGTLTISQSDITASNVTVSGVAASYPFNGVTAVKPPITLYCDGNKLTEGKDYTVTYGPNNTTGEKKGTVTITGINNFRGTRTLTFDIEGIAIDGYTVTLRESSVNWDGAAHVPVVTSVKLGYTTLPTSKYDVSYENSAGQKVAALVNADTYKVVISGKDGYSGKTSTTYRVIGKPQTIKIEKTAYKVYITTKPFKISASATGDGTGFRYVSSDPTVASVDANGIVTVHKLGRARITVTTTGNMKSDPASDDVYVKVHPKKTRLTQKPWTDSQKKSFRVRWAKQDDVTKYQIRYSRDKRFSEGSYLTKTVRDTDVRGTQSTRITGLTPGTYYVKVRAVKEVYNENGKKLTYYGLWSNWRSVKVK